MLGNEHIEHRHEDGTHWMMMHKQPGVRPCCHRGLLDGVVGGMIEAGRTFELAGHHPSGMEHLVVGSLAPVFNLGGDLEYFVQTIEQQDRDGLLSYAEHCVNGVHAVHHHLHGKARTIALVQGDALGGGMELALACQTIVIERGARMGLPEVLFGLFPGMGAYPFLCQRVSPQRAESLILGGKVYDADELLSMGVVDHVADPGMGPKLVKSLIARERRGPMPTWPWARSGGGRRMCTMRNCSMTCICGSIRYFGCPSDRWGS